MPYDVRVDSIKIAYVLGRPGGGVERDLLKRGLRVETKAKLLLSGAGANHPKRVDTGRLRASIRTVPARDHGKPVVRVGTAVRYALWVHDGTGIYGPRRAPITPVTAKVLRFRPAGSPVFLYRRSVRGMRGNPFLKDALPAAALG
jgi:hypothetical protein